ncbi:hypothetical protein HLH48_07130 [Gluconacetobacter sacchari]|uniref:DNA-binding protein n=2 Tax=Gluconacetobacter sacchari TaxID=92759 RepID=A0A7W4IBQ5_9PROT|nr:hypothetical protein [Gluconacetobacter sacchari]
MIVDHTNSVVETRSTAAPVRLVVSEGEAAAMLNMAPRTLQGKRLDGSGPPFVRLSDRRIGYAVADLQSWIASRSVRSTSEATVRRIGGGQ